MTIGGLRKPSQPFVPNPSEVRSVFEVPLGWLIDERNYGTYRITRNGYEHTTPQIGPIPKFVDF